MTIPLTDPIPMWANNGSGGFSSNATFSGGVGFMGVVKQGVTGNGKPI
jgi:hypothetical protein